MRFVTMSIARRNMQAGKARTAFSVAGVAVATLLLCFVVGLYRGWNDAIGAYIHPPGKIGVLIEVNCESDFVARTEDFQRLCHDVAMHIAALDTRYVRREDVTQEILDREREIYKAQARATGKPEPVIEKIVNGKMEKFYEENCLYEQHFIKDESVTVGELVSQMIHKLGENISIRRYVRFKVGEGAGSSAESAAVAAPAS